MKVILGIFGSLIALGVCFVLGFAWRDLRNLELPSSETMGSLVSGRSSNRLVAPKAVFKSVFNNILTDYHGIVEPKELRHAGMMGLVAALGDPHTMFFDPEFATAFANETAGNFVGIGARLSPDPLGASIAVVFEDGPAFRAGIKKSDLIVEVDGKSVAGVPVDEIVTRIRGEEGTNVRLQLMRPGVARPINLSVKRAQVVMPTVEADLVPGTKIGYIGVSQFSARTATQFDQALDKVERGGARALIIDLRNNGGGLLDTAVDMLSRFLDDKPVVQLKERDGTIKPYRSLVGYKIKKEYPIVVLINSESASASEIFAGVMSDYKKATLVGERTYGKMSVQNVYELIDGSSAKITVARYYIPSGRDISRKEDDEGVYISGGLEPDVRVKFKSLADPTSTEYRIVPQDSQISKAVEILKKKLGG